VGEIGFPAFEAVKMVQTQAQHAGGRQDVVFKRDEPHKYGHVIWVHNSTDMMVQVCRRTVEYKLLGKEKFWVTTRPIHKLIMVVSMEEQLFENKLEESIEEMDREDNILKEVQGQTRKAWEGITQRRSTGAWVPPVLPGGRNFGQKAQKWPRKNKVSQKNLWPNFYQK
jgi:hypothetical protein